MNELIEVAKHQLSMGLTDSATGLAIAIAQAEALERIAAALEQMTGARKPALPADVLAQRIYAQRRMVGLHGEQPREWVELPDFVQREYHAEALRMLRLMEPEEWKQ